MPNISDAVEVVNATGDNFQKRPLVSIIVVLLIVVAALFWGIWDINKEKNEVIAQKDQQLIKCKDEFAAKVESLMTQAESQRQNLLTRQSILIEKVDYLTRAIEKKKR
jgi:CHASE3 domain sensor protein